METLRFLMVSTFYPPYHLGGDATHVQYLARALAEKGHEVHVEFAPAAYGVKRRGAATPHEPPDDGVHLHPIPSPFGPLQPASAYLLGRSRSVERHHGKLAREIRPDVIHHHNISLLGRTVIGKSRANRTVYTAHDYWIRCPRSDLFKYGRFPCDAPTCLRCAIVSRRAPQLWRRAWDSRRLEGLDVAIAPSRFMKESIERSLPCPVVHIPNFAPDRNSTATISPPGDYYLFVGVQEFHKGILQLAAVAREARDGFRFVFAGRGSYDRYLRNLRAEGASNVEVAGWLDSAALAPLYRGARALIMPSLSHENAPLSAIEALSWGSPLLVSRRGGLPELTRGDTVGLTFEPNPTQIAETIHRFEANDFPKRLRVPAREAYEAHHRPESYLASYLSLMDDGPGRLRTEHATGTPLPEGSARGASSEGSP